MIMNKKILFPFHFEKDNKQLFCSVLEMVEEEEGNQLVCFTSVCEEDKLDDVYLHLLELFGFYQTTNNSWGKSMAEIKKDIKVGVFIQELFNYLSFTKVDVLIADPESLVLDPEFLEKLLSNNANKPEIITLNSKEGNKCYSSRK